MWSTSIRPSSEYFRLHHNKYAIPFLYHASIKTSVSVLWQVHDVWFLIAPIVSFLSTVIDAFLMNFGQCFVKWVTAWIFSLSCQFFLRRIFWPGEDVRLQPHKNYIKNRYNTTVSEILCVEVNVKIHKIICLHQNPCDNPQVYFLQNKSSLSSQA